MDYKIFIIFGIAALVKGDPCALPNGDKGVCKPLKDCSIINKIHSKPRKDIDEEFIERLKKSRCDFDDDKTAVCCPKSDTLSCTTPEYLEGRCVGLSSCPHLAELAKSPEKSHLLNDYACTGSEDINVCCGTPAEDLNFRSEYESECEAKATAYPPEVSSDCCGIDDVVEDKILGGKDATIDAYPWLAAIEYVNHNERYLLCGGTLISVKYVLTAAHCVKGPVLFIAKPKYVRLGDHNMANKGPDCVPSGDCNHGALIIPIERAVTHPDFRPYHSAKKFDIALIRLKAKAPYTAFIRPICLPSKDYTRTPPKELFVAGWGTYKQNVTANIYNTSEIKQYVELPYVNRQKCERAIQKLRQTNSTSLWYGQICAGGVPGKDSCNADSGGPLMLELDRIHEILGIVSFGAEVCGQESVPAVYTYVYDFVPWIKKAIKP